MNHDVPAFNRLGLPAVAIGTTVVLGTGVSLSFDSTRDLLLRWWWVPMVLGAAALVLVLRYLTAKQVERWRAMSPDQWRERWWQQRAALMMFVAVPALIFLVGGVAVLPQHLQLVAIRAVLLLLVCLLPAILWYLFIATRRASLLNEFLANLDRLGLMRQQVGESEVTMRRRVSGYLQRFGAVYGDLPEKVHHTVQKGEFERYTRSDFNSSTGMTTAVVPVLTATGLIAIGWLLTLPPVDVMEQRGEVVPWVQALTPTLEPITLAFIGAYFFSLQVLFRRYALKDLRGSAYISVSMRIILAIIGVWVLTVVNDRLGLLSEGMLFTVAFAIGVFPVVLWQIISHQLKKLTFLTVPSMRAELPLDRLDGLTVWHQARLEEEDIENVPNMATADLVDLLLNTRLAPNRIIDWTDQAILDTQLGPDTGELRGQLHAKGIRNASTFLQVAANDRAKVFDTDADKAKVAAIEAAIRTNDNLRHVQCWRRLDRQEALEPAQAATPAPAADPIAAAASVADPIADPVAAAAAPAAATFADPVAAATPAAAPAIQVADPVAAVADPANPVVAPTIPVGPAATADPVAAAADLVADPVAAATLATDPATPAASVADPVADPDAAAIPATTVVAPTIPVGPAAAADPVAVATPATDPAIPASPATPAIPGPAQATIVEPLPGTETPRPVAPAGEIATG
jgi:hypothetical protein